MNKVMTKEEFLKQREIRERIAVMIELEMVDAKNVETMKAFNDAIRLAARIARGLS